MSNSSSEPSIPKAAVVPTVAANNSYSEGCAWIGGRFLPINEARIPILDVGFGHSDLTYDVAAVWDGRFFRLQDHLERLQRGVARLRMESPLTVEEIRMILMETVARSGIRDAYVAAIVTRGVPQPGRRDPRQFTPQFYGYAVPYIWIVDQETQDRGTSLAIARETVRIPSRSIDPTVKNFQWGDLTRGLFEAFDAGASTTILTDGAGNLTEGAGYNVFALTDGRLHTAADGVLRGITRKTVIEIAAEMGIETVVGQFAVETLEAAGEIFLTSTAGGVMPVATLDGRAVGAGKPGPVTRQIRDTYWHLHRDERFTEAVDYSDDRNVESVSLRTTQ